MEIQTIPLSAGGMVAYRCRIYQDETLLIKTYEGICRENDTPDILNPTPSNEGWYFIGEEALLDIGCGGWEEVYDHTASGLEYSIAAAKLGRLVRLDVERQMVFDPSGKPCPVGLFFHKAEISNDKYDLELAFEHLSDHPEIAGLQDIQRVSRYLPSDFLSFWWAPEPTNYQRAWLWCLENGGKHPHLSFAKAIFALDLFGLRACGSAKYSSYEESDFSRE